MRALTRALFFIEIGSTKITASIMKTNFKGDFTMKKIASIMAAIYMALCLAVVGWAYGCPKSFGRFLGKWQAKLDEGFEEEEE